jgi:hypothetical protein
MCEYVFVCICLYMSDLGAGAVVWHIICVNMCLCVYVSEHSYMSDLAAEAVVRTLYV